MALVLHHRRSLLTVRMAWAAASLALGSCSSAGEPPQGCREIKFSQGPSAVMRSSGVKDVVGLNEWPVRLVQAVEVALPADESLSAVSSILVQPASHDALPAAGIACRARQDLLVCKGPVGMSWAMVVVLQASRTGPPEQLFKTARDYVEKEVLGCP